MHVEIFVGGAVVALEPHRRVLGNVRDNAIDDRDSLPVIVLAGWRTDVLSLVSFAGWTQRHAPVADFTVVIALAQRIIVSRVAFAAAGFSLAAPTAATETPNLRIHVGVIAGGEFQGKQDIW
jgi:hypothetical protein